MPEAATTITSSDARPVPAGRGTDSRVSAAVTRYIVVNRDFDPANPLVSPTNGPYPFLASSQANAATIRFAAMTPFEPCNKVTMKIVITYRVVADRSQMNLAELIEAIQPPRRKRSGGRKS